MATLGNKRKLVAVTRETQEENPRNGQSRNTSVPRINEDYITQVSEEIEGRVKKELSQKFSRTESLIFGALTKLDEFLSNQQLHKHSETVPGTFRSTNVENQETNEDDSQSDPHPEAGIFRGQTTQNLGPKNCRDSSPSLDFSLSSSVNCGHHWECLCIDSLSYTTRKMAMKLAWHSLMNCPTYPSENPAGRIDSHHKS